MVRGKESQVHNYRVDNSLRPRKADMMLIYCSRLYKLMKAMIQTGPETLGQYASL